MSDPRARRETADPLQMSLAEKLACEWEARHDVAARGRIADIAPVQHYLEHRRVENHRKPSSRSERPAHPRSAPPSDVPPGLLGWLRWGEDGPSSTGSVLPRGC